MLKKRKSKFQWIFSLKTNIWHFPYKKFRKLYRKKWKRLKKKFFMDWVRDRHKRYQEYKPNAKMRKKIRNDYKYQLHEKTKFKVYFNLSEKDLKKVIRKARYKTVFLSSILLRLDLVLIQSNFARTVKEAREYIRYGLVHINNNKIYQSGRVVRPDRDIVSVDPYIKPLIYKNIIYNMSKDGWNHQGIKIPSYLEMNYRNLEILVFRDPTITHSSKKEMRKFLKLKELRKLCTKRKIYLKNAHRWNHKKSRWNYNKLRWKLQQKLKKARNRQFTDFLYPLPFDLQAVFRSYKR